MVRAGLVNGLPGAGEPPPFPARGRRDRMVLQRGSGAAVAHHLAKVRVAGSNPVFRSIPAGQGWSFKPYLNPRFIWQAEST